MAAAPIRISCNGTSLDPQTGRASSSGVVVFGFEFDAKTQGMAVTVYDGEAKRIPLRAVKITDGLAIGSDDKWVYEVNRIEGTATLRINTDTDPDALRQGLTGNFYKGKCSVTGKAKF